MKGTGSTPIDLGAQLQLSVPAHWMYSLDMRVQRRSAITAPGSNAIAPGTVVATVPDGELWVVNAVTFYITTDATGAGTFRMIRAVNSNATPGYTFGDPITLAASTVGRTGEWFTFGDCVMTPGNYFTLAAVGVVTATVTADICLDYFRVGL
jgi:hypothetical protein